MNRALVVGCAGYEDPDIAPLRHAQTDAARVADTLRTVCGVDDADLVLLHDNMPASHRPTRTNLLRHLTRMAADPRPDGILYFFFSGHGFQAGDNTQYLLPIDCVRAAVEDTALRFDVIVRYLGAAAAPHLVLFLDACRNVLDGGKAASASLPRVDVDALCPPGVVSFCSCRPGRVSYEVDGIRAGVFTEALCSAFSPAGRCRTIHELDAYLSTQVPALARAHGKPDQRPHSRVEPLGVQHLELVSERTRNQWRATTPIGTERRARRVAPVVPPGAVDDPLLAIDFGTSYSVVSWYRPEGDVLLLPGPDGRPLVPSVLHFLPDMDYLVGAAAVEATPYRPSSTIRHAKRDLGRSAGYSVNGRSIEPVLAVGLILRSLRRNAEEALGTPVRRCLASHPANFTLRQIDTLEQAFELADLTVTRMIGEPNAASLLTLMATPEQEQDYLVVDLGGGTFDVALVEAGEGIAEVRAVTGSNEVGGLDFDDALVAYAEDQLRTVHGWHGELTSTVRDKLRREAERAKRDLGYRDATTMLLTDLDGGSHGLVDISIELDRARFRQLTAELNDTIRSTLGAVFPRLRFGEDVSAWISRGGKVLLAGQGTKIFTVSEQIASVLPGAEVVSSYQETAVAHGLGTQAGVLTGFQRGFLLLNALRFGVGVRVSGKEGSLHLVSPDAGSNKEVMTLLDSSRTIPTRDAESFRLTGKAGTTHEMTFVEIPRSSGLVFGTIPVVATGGDIVLTADVEANGVVYLTLRDEKTDSVSRYQLNKLGQDR
ncbi:Hsp70 family protein [Amycolatopsis vancoresmycina]|uniref:Molecular chaperone DnaK n=1 Tax=Amycolatopsis vancoresmycina DSM 44592 TaxID=1292037 RepID=R1G295_9PSEU|nr:Hsp70 family protein [Amycolatopsis vancoresmycina]EOD65592.1 molecular chaperone DnaK [Amycolatopsis vancoresmycina DSM 44592]